MDMNENHSFFVFSLTNTIVYNFHVYLSVYHRDIYFYTFPIFYTLINLLFLMTMIVYSQLFEEPVLSESSDSDESEDDAGTESESDSDSENVKKKLE